MRIICSLGLVMWALASQAAVDIAQKNSDGSYSIWCENDFYLTRTDLAKATKVCENPSSFLAHLDAQWGTKGHLFIKPETLPDMYVGYLGRANRLTDGSLVLAVTYSPKKTEDKPKNFLLKIDPMGKRDESFGAKNALLELAGYPAAIRPLADNRMLVQLSGGNAPLHLVLLDSKGKSLSELTSNRVPKGTTVHEVHPLKSGYLLSLVTYAPKAKTYTLSLAKVKADLSLEEKFGTEGLLEVKTSQAPQKAALFLQTSQNEDEVSLVLEEVNSYRLSDVPQDKLPARMDIRETSGGRFHFVFSEPFVSLLLYQVNHKKAETKLQAQEDFVAYAGLSYLPVSGAKPGVKRLVVGASGSTDLVIRRYEISADKIALDPSFGVKGQTLVNLGYADSVEDMLEAKDGSLYLLGQSYTQRPQNDDGEFTSSPSKEGVDEAIAKLTPNGELDRSFGNLGLLKTVPTGLTYHTLTSHKEKLMLQGGSFFYQFTESSKSDSK